jgi:hypothetical protein
MGRLCLILAMLIAATVMVPGQQRCDKEYSLGKGVALFCPPADWTSTQEKDRKYLSFEKKVGPATFPPSLMIDEEKATEAPIELYVYGMVKGLFDMESAGADKVTGKRVMDLVEFKTTSGLKGTKLVTEMTIGSMPTRSIYYVFEVPGFVYTFTAISGADDGSTGAAFDAIMKTMRVVKK